MSKHPDSDSLPPELPLPAAPKLPKKSEKESESSTPEEPGGPSWRRYLVWAVIGLLGVAAVAEFRAQAAYKKTIALCNTAMEKEEGKSPADVKRITYDEVKDRFPPGAVYTKEVHSFVQSGVYTWTWQGVRRYKVHLYVNLKDGTVFDVTSEP